MFTVYVYVLSFCVLTGMARKEDQLNQSQKLLAIRCVK